MKNLRIRKQYQYHLFLQRKKRPMEAAKDLRIGHPKSAATNSETWCLQEKEKQCFDTNNKSNKTQTKNVNHLVTKGTNIILLFKKKKKKIF